MPSLRNLRIRTRILLLTISVVVFILCLSLWLGSVLQRNLLQEKMSGVGTALDTASNLLAHYDKQVQQYIGAMSAINEVDKIWKNVEGG